MPEHPTTHACDCGEPLHPRQNVCWECQLAKKRATAAMWRQRKSVQGRSMDSIVADLIRDGKL